MKYFGFINQFIYELKCILHERRHRNAILILLFLSVLVFILSTVFAGNPNENPSTPKYLQFIISTLNFISNYRIEIILIIVLLLILILIVICLFCFLVCNSESNNTEVLKTNLETTSNVVKWGFYLFLSSFFIYALIFITRSGGLFVFITGVATVIGAYIAIQSIIEMKHTITSYAQLHVRVTALINEAVKAGEDIYILSYSPLSGHWQNKSTKILEQFEYALSNVEVNKKKIHFACLDECDHFRLLLTIACRRTDKKAEQVIYLQHQYNKLIQNNIIKKLKWEKMPTYYLFTSERRTILVTPVKLPYPEIDEKEVQMKLFNLLKTNGNNVKNEIDKYIKKKFEEFNEKEREQEKEILSSRPTVETLGFETTDHHIIQTIKEEFNRFANNNN